MHVGTKELTFLTTQCHSKALTVITVNGASKIFAEMLTSGFLLRATLLLRSLPQKITMRSSSRKMVIFASL